MNMFKIYIGARYETRMLLICCMVVGRFKNLRRKLGMVYLAACTDCCLGWCFKIFGSSEQLQAAITRLSE